MAEKQKADTLVVDPTVFKMTRDSLKQFVKKPPLTDKLLNKPPFRFLHDIMTTVISTTGFMTGLFSDAEMISDNVTEKEAKIAFLQKAIDMVSLVTGRALAVKPEKIVAGLEPEKTNEFLQALAEAISKKVNNDEYVQRVLAGDSNKKKSGSQKPKKKEKSAKEPVTDSPGAKGDKIDEQEGKPDVSKSKTDKKEDSSSKSEAKSDRKKSRSGQNAVDKLEKSEIGSDNVESKKNKPGMKPEKQSSKQDAIVAGGSDKIESKKTSKQETKSSKSDSKADKQELEVLKQDSSRDKSGGKGSLPLADVDKPSVEKKEVGYAKLASNTEKKTGNATDGKQEVSQAATADKIVTGSGSRISGSSGNHQSNKITGDGTAANTEKKTGNTVDGKQEVSYAATDDKIGTSGSKVSGNNANSSHHGNKVTCDGSATMTEKKAGNTVDGKQAVSHAAIAENIGSAASGSKVSGSSASSSHHSNKVTGDGLSANTEKKTGNAVDGKPEVSHAATADKIGTAASGSKITGNTRSSSSSHHNSKITDDEHDFNTNLEAHQEMSSSLSNRITGQRNHQKQESEHDKQKLKFNTTESRTDEIGGKSFHVSPTLKATDGNKKAKSTELGVQPHKTDVHESKRADEHVDKDKQLVSDPVRVKEYSGKAGNARFDDSSARNMKLQDETRDLRYYEQPTEQVLNDKQDQRTRRDKIAAGRFDQRGEGHKSTSGKESRADKVKTRSSHHELLSDKEENEGHKIKSWKSMPKAENMKTNDSQMVNTKSAAATTNRLDNQLFPYEQKSDLEPETLVDVILDRKREKTDKGSDYDNDEEDDDNKDTFLISSDNTIPAGTAADPFGRASEDLGEHGGLVKKILKTKKGLEALVISHKSMVEIDRSEVIGGDMSRKQQRDALMKDIGKLRSAIQGFTGNIIPLVRILDFLQEDLDSMKKEMDHWRQEIEANSTALQQEQRLMESAIEPLRIQLSELEKEIAEQEDTNAALKSQALLNEEKMRQAIAYAALLAK